MPALLQLNAIYKSYGPQIIFEDASATLSTDQKVAFIGRNGAGKSTLCKIITGEENADSGEVIKSGDLRLSYLEQHDPFRDGERVLEFLVRYTGQEAWRCGEIAGRFQLKNNLLESPVRGLSGGYQTRVKLSAMLLQEPNFLILDEPSNYLDLKTLILLEEFLQDFSGGFLIVSHDREFLKKTCDHTLEADGGRLEIYPGTVEEYLQFKQEMEEQTAARNQTIAEKRKQLQTFVDRFKAKASKAAQARSKMKQIEKLKLLELPEARAAVRIRIPRAQRRNGIVFRCEDLAIGYPEKLIAERIDLEMEHGARVAILGDNGQGKTTFMRTIAGDLEPKGGSFRWGFGCETSYYAQHVTSSMDPNTDVYTHLEQTADASLTREEILAMAGCFLFKGPDLKKPIKVLSGGERARLCLAGLLLRKRAVLLLDEPTNHLDFETVESLGAALSEYEGTVFFISHDRTFVNMAATQIIEVKDGAVIGYPGTYAEYVYRMETEVRADVSGRNGQQDAGRASKPVSDYHQRKRRDAEMRKLASRIKRCEEQQENYRQEKAVLEAEMAANPGGWNREVAERFGELERLLREEENLWVELTTQLEALSG